MKRRKIYIFFCSVLLLHCLWAGAEEAGPVESVEEKAAQLEVEVERAPLEPAPEILPVVPVVVHHRNFALTKRWLFQVGPAILSGDSYLNSRGLGGEVSYFFRENLGAAGGGYFLRSWPAANAEILGRGRSMPVAHDPRWLAYGSVVFSPWYGKFSLGSRIQRFQWSVSLGGHLAKETTHEGIQSKLVGSKTLPGLNAGTSLLFPINQRFSASLRAGVFFHRRLFEEESAGRRNIIYAIQLGYLL